MARAVRRKLSLSRNVRCEVCSGSGTKSGKRYTCEVCHGSGTQVCHDAATVCSVFTVSLHAAVVINATRLWRQDIVAGSDATPC
jgi:DnaJ-class molecular chaperone